VALSLLGNDLARTEKFSTSLKDGLDLRETLRNWHTGELHVKVLPPSRGSLDCIVMLFDSPADPRDYPMRVTWHAEHQDESSLAFFATDAGANLIGPGIAQATYGGALFLFPPRPLEDIWTDRRFDAATTLEERLLMAGCFYSREKHVVVLSAAPPGAGWRKLAAQLKRKLIHVPLSRFSQDTLSQLQVFHILLMNLLLLPLLLQPFQHHSLLVLEFHFYFFSKKRRLLRTQVLNKLLKNLTQLLL
jgi:hypothetical protein